MSSPVQELARRLLPEHIRSRVEFHLQPGREFFAVDRDRKGCVHIEGSSELALACGLHDYLKYDCHVHYSWCGSRSSFPAAAPLPEKRRETRPPLPLRPYLNYCAFGYSLAWWDLERWEREIDFMALNGINLPLAATGVESVWQATFRRLGISDRGIAAFLSGPAFLPWQWMDNLDGHAGPLPESWIESHRQLGREIVRRECAWGMNPILPGFSGHVPAEFAARHPEAEYLPESEWCNFPSVKVLDPADPWFGKITRVYMEELTALFGATHYYAIDLFHERMIPNRPAEFFATLGREISAILAECDPQAVWVMQAWTENADIIRAIPRERLLILDIGKHRLEATKGLFGAPTVHGMIHSFGGHTEIGGSLDGAVAELEAIRHYPNLIGAGVFPESINNNPVLFELFLENALSERPIDVTRWLPGYVLRRYGRAPESALKAWEHLHRHVYTGRRGDPFIAARPRLEPDRANAWAEFHEDDTPERFFPAWEGLLEAAAECGGSDAFRFDLIDVGRQALSSLGRELFAACRKAFLAREAEQLAVAKQKFLTYLEDFDALLSSRPEFRLDTMISEARRWGRTPAEADLFERNVRLQLTLWGPENAPELLFDYCCREWQGLIGGYYHERWKRFFTYLQTLLSTGKTLDESALRCSENRPALEANDFYRELYRFECAWVNSTEPTLRRIQEDEIAVSRRMLRKYRPCRNRTAAIIEPETTNDLLVGFIADNHLIARS